MDGLQTEGVCSSRQSCRYRESTGTGSQCCMLQARALRSVRQAGGASGLPHWSSMPKSPEVVRVTSKPRASREGRMLSGWRQGRHLRRVQCSGGQSRQVPAKKARAVCAGTEASHSIFTSIRSGVLFQKCRLVKIVWRAGPAVAVAATFTAVSPYSCGIPVADDVFGHRHFQPAVLRGVCR